MSLGSAWAFAAGGSCASVVGRTQWCSPPATIGLIWLVTRGGGGVGPGRRLPVAGDEGGGGEAWGGWAGKGREMGGGPPFPLP